MKLKIRIYIDGEREENPWWTVRQFEDIKTGIHNAIPGNYDIDKVDHMDRQNEFVERTDFFILNAEEVDQDWIGRRLTITPGQTSSYSWDNFDSVEIKIVRLRQR